MKDNEILQKAKEIKRKLKLAKAAITLEKKITSKASAGEIASAIFSFVAQLDSATLKDYARQLVKLYKQ